MTMREGTIERARGRWPGILTALGVDKRFLVNRHGPCPFCGGKDRFRFDDKGEGSHFCSGCGAGYGLAFLEKFHKWDFKTAADAVDKIVGAVKATPTVNRQSEPRQREAMNQLWRASVPVQLDDPVGRYLNRRCGLTTFPPCLRYSEVTRYHMDEGPPRYFPAMIAMMVAPDGKPCILHRTYLTEDGNKAPVEKPRRLMPGSVAKGGAIRLAEAIGEVLGIAEGVETALSASTLHRLPCWSAVSDQLLAQWEPPSGLKRVVIFGDRDPAYAGQAAAYALAKRLALDTKRGIDVEVRLPDRKDWNDVHSAMEKTPC